LSYSCDLATVTNLGQMGTASTVGCDHLMLYIAILATDKFQELNIFRI